MFATGLIAIAQMTALPGALLLKCFPDGERNVIESIVYGFGLSLIANAVLVPLLVLGSIYTAGALWCIILIEAALLFGLAVRKGRAWDTIEIRLAGLADLIRPGSFAKSLALILAGATVLLFLDICYQNWGTVFMAVDDLANWDRWACEWAGGNFPRTSWWYPQLLPANWSLAYVLTATVDVKTFAKSITTLFPFCTLLLFLAAALRRRRVAHLWGLVSTGWLFMHYFGPGFMTFGYADIPLAFFSLLTFYPFYVFRYGTELPADKAFTPFPVPPPTKWLVLTFACGAMLLKQGAILGLTICILWLVYDRFKRRNPLFAAGTRPAAAVALVTLLMVASWYVYKYAQMRAGVEASNLYDLMHSIHAGRNYWQRLEYAWLLIWHARGITGPMMARILIVIFAAGLVVRATRPIMLWLVVPFLSCWALWFSYELRTVSAVVPLLGLVAGLVIARGIALIRWKLPRQRTGALLAAALVGITAAYLKSQVGAAQPVTVGLLMPYFKDMWTIGAVSIYTPCLMCAAGAMVVAFSLYRQNGALRIWWPPLAAAAAALAIVLSFTVYRTETIVNSQAALLRQNGIPALNEKLYAVVKEKQIHSRISSAYLPLRTLPGIGRLYRMITCNSPCSIQDLRAVRSIFPDVGYILIGEPAIDAPSRAALNSTSDLKTVFVDQGYRMIELENGLSPSSSGR